MELEKSQAKAKKKNLKRQELGTDDQIKNPTIHCLANVLHQQTPNKSLLLLLVLLAFLNSLVNCMLGLQHYDHLKRPTQSEQTVASGFA